ncbi:MAG: type II secretion system protein GspD [Armatimonadetes bacterium]|nr:type II secretion system protein GspD [Armatimonadota bacterium]
MLSQDQVKYKYNKMSKHLTAALLLVLLFAVCSSGTADQAAQPGLYDVDASGGDIRYVLEALARQSGANIVVRSSVTGQVTAHLKQMPLDELLDNLSSAHGFTWTKKDSTYLISTAPDEAKTEVTPPPPVPKYESLIWRCRHIKVKDMVSLLTEMLPDCKVAPGPSLISPTLQAPLSSASEVTGAGSSSTATSSSSHVSSDDAAQTVVLYGRAEDIANAKALLEKLDTPRPQIAIEVAITEIRTDQAKDMGISWSWSEISLTESDTSGIRFGKFSKGPMSFTGVLSALKTSENTRLLAQPNISVIDGGYADILLGERILFPKLVSYTQLGTPIYDKEEERVGIYLQIAPRISEDDEITLSLYPQVSLVTGYLTTQAGDYPQISTREARTTVSVKSGATLAIGGLIKDEEIKNAEKIPLLGDLPIIGGFFRHNKNTKVRTEIVIFLTPRIVSSSADGK